MKPLLFAILLSAPVMLHGQILSGLASVSGSSSAMETGSPSDSSSFSSTSATGDFGGSHGAGSGSSSAGGSAYIGEFAEFGPDIFQVRFQLTNLAYPYTRGDQEADSTAQTTVSLNFTVSSPGIFTISPFRFANSGSYHNSSSAGSIDGDSIWEVSLNSSAAGPLFQLSGSDRTGTVTTSADLGFLQPGVTYTLSVSASAHAHATGFSGSLPGYEGLGVSLDGTLSFAPVPEPATYALMVGTGLLGFAFWRRVKKNGPSSTNQGRRIRF